MDQAVDKQKYQKPQWYKKTERLLKWKKYLPAEIENLQIQLQMDRWSGQRITAQYRESIGQSLSISSPLVAIVSREESVEEKIRYRELLLQMLENTVKSFTQDERIVYDLRYDSELKDKQVYTGLKMSRSAYFELQRQVVLKAARLLNIPVPLKDQPEEWKGQLFEKCLD